MTNLQKVSGVISTVLLMLLVPGCFGGNGVPLGSVEGRVTKDGSPISDATVTFFPEEGRPSVGVTDSDGRYSLQFTRDLDGAMVGKHRVNITYGGRQAPPDASDPTRRAKPVKSIPRQDIDWAEDIEVSRSDNTIDFDF